MKTREEQIDEAKRDFFRDLDRIAAKLATRFTREEVKVILTIDKAEMSDTLDEAFSL